MPPAGRAPRTSGGLGAGRWPPVRPGSRAGRSHPFRFTNAASVSYRRHSETAREVTGAVCLTARDVFTFSRTPRFVRRRRPARRQKPRSACSARPPAPATGRLRCSCRTELSGHSRWIPVICSMKPSDAKGLLRCGPGRPPAHVRPRPPHTRGGHGRPCARPPPAPPPAAPQGRKACLP